MAIQWRFPRVTGRNLFTKDTQSQRLEGQWLASRQPFGDYPVNWLLFLTILIQVESGGDKTVVGDQKLKHHAYGVCQIRQPYLDDVNKFARTHYTLAQIADNEGLSRWAVQVYVKHYGERYTKLTGQPLTMEIAARIHNAGPNGWKKSSTDAYWMKFKRLLGDEGYNPIVRNTKDNEVASVAQ
jgi:hypothetical protein